MNDNATSTGKTYIDNIKSVSHAKDVLRQNKITWTSHSNESFFCTFKNKDMVPVAKFYKDSKSLVLLISQ